MALAVAAMLSVTALVALLPNPPVMAISADDTIIAGAVTVPPKLASAPLSMLADVPAARPASVTAPLAAAVKRPVATAPDSASGPPMRTGASANSAAKSKPAAGPSASSVPAKGVNMLALAT